MSIADERFMEVLARSPRSDEPRKPQGLVLSGEFIEKMLEDTVVRLKDRILLANHKGDNSLLELFNARKMAEKDRVQGLRNAVADRFTEMGFVTRCFAMDDSAVVYPLYGETIFQGPSLWVYGVEISWLPNAQAEPTPETAVLEASLEA